jgi:hypothetical protein
MNLRPNPVLTNEPLHLPASGGRVLTAMQRLSVLAQRLGRDPDRLLKQALDYLLGKYETKYWGGLFASQPSPDSDRPLVHVRLLSDSEAKPLWGASDAPWGVRLFEFTGLTCPEFQSRVVHPDDDPA